jgi:dGTPase
LLEFWNDCLSPVSFQLAWSPAMKKANVGRNDRLQPDSPREGDLRTPGQHDRDRILHSSAFRRLAGVTQVVAASEEGFLLHNRLTHTLKVAQVARRIAERVSLEPAAKILSVDPDVVEAAALAHDLGHPPFGHVAEQALDRIASPKLTDAFEGNAQSFRIVTKLSRRAPQAELAGLNLTRATLNAILKYPWHRGSGGTKKENKWGAFHTEETEFEFARAVFMPGDERKSAEAEIMDWADDIAYSVHDVEDFYRVGLIPLDRLATEEAEVQEFLDGALARRKQLPNDKYRTKPDLLVNAFNRIRENFFPRRRYRGLESDRGNVRVVTGLLIDRFAKALHLQVPANDGEDRVAIDVEPEQEVTILKELTWYYVINSPALATQQHGQKELIERLYRTLEDAALKQLFLFPPSSRESLDLIESGPGNTADKERRKRRIVIDVISGMTEREALTMHQRLAGFSPGSALERLYFG